MLEKVYAVEIAAPPERVWAEITRTGSRCRPMFGTVLVTDLRPGSPIRWRSPDGRYTFVAGEVLEVDAPRRLVHTFTFPNLPDAPTRVTWELAPTAKGTRVTVVHSGFDAETKTFRSIDGGWPKILDLYRREIEEGQIPLGDRIRLGMMGCMYFLLPRSLRTDVVDAKLAAGVSGGRPGPRAGAR